MDFFSAISMFFSEIGNHPTVRAGQKKHIFFCKARLKSNAHTHLKQRKIIVALDIYITFDIVCWIHSQQQILIIVFITICPDDVIPVLRLLNC